MPTLIYRIEHSSGPHIGPFHADYAPKSLMRFGFAVYGNGPRHYEPHNDALLGPFWNSLGARFAQYFFGFSSLGQLRNWFHRDIWLYALHKCGYVIGVYDAVNVQHGDVQSVFNLNLSTRVDEISLIEPRVINLSKEGS